MKNVSSYFLCLLFFAVACSSQADKEKDEASENDLDAARSFIQASLKGQYSKARDFMLSDSANDQYMDAVSRMPLSSAEKQGLWDASINIHSRRLANDSTSIIIYSNSFHKDNRDTLKVIKRDGKWLVDFKYLFNKETSDTLTVHNSL